MSPIVTGLLLAVALSVFAMIMAGRVGVLIAMKREGRLDDIPFRVKQLLRFGLGQRRMVDPEEFTPGLMHVFIFAAFLVLQLRSAMMFAMGFSATALAVLTDLGHPFWAENAGLLDVYRVYLLIKDVVATLAVLGVLYFTFLRSKVKPDRITPSWEAYLILGFIGGLMVTEFLFGGSHMVAQNGGFAWWEPTTSVVGLAMGALGPTGAHVLGLIGFWTHLLIILAFLNFLPLGKHFHIITGLPNVFFQRTNASGKLGTPNLEKEEFGTATVRI